MTSVVVRQVYWSKNAVVCLRDGVMCLVWRFVDIQQSQLLETHFRAQIRSTYVTQEGEVFNNYMRWVVGSYIRNRALQFLNRCIYIIDFHNIKRWPCLLIKKAFSKYVACSGS